MHSLTTFVPYILANLLQCQRASVTMELNLLLFHVKEKLSEVLLPVETVTKLEILGKGMYVAMYWANRISLSWSFCL